MKTLEYFAQNALAIYAASGIITFLILLIYETFKKTRTSRTPLRLMALLYFPLAVPGLNIVYILAMPHSWDALVYLYFYGFQGIVFSIEQRFFSDKYVRLAVQPFWPAMVTARNTVTGQERDFLVLRRSDGAKSFISYWTRSDADAPRLLLSDEMTAMVVNMRDTAM